MARLLTLRTVSEAVALERDAVTRGIGAGVVIVGVVARLLVFSVLERASVIRGGGIDGEKETEVATGRVANGEGIKAEEGGGDAWDGGKFAGIFSIGGYTRRWHVLDVSGKATKLMRVSG